MAFREVGKFHATQRRYDYALACLYLYLESDTTGSARQEIEDIVDGIHAAFPGEFAARTYRFRGRMTVVLRG